MDPHEQTSVPAPADSRALHMLLRFRRLMARLMLLMLAMVGLGAIGLRRGAAAWAVHAVFGAAALCALAMLLVPLAMAWALRRRK